MPVALITGSDSGIGKATAALLARRGWDVGITWHEDEDGARRTAEEAAAAGARTALCHADLTDVETGALVVGRLADDLGGVDALVNNAGTGTIEPLVDMETSTFRSVLDVNLVAAFTAAREAARRMVAAGRGGRIVNITSVHEHVPLRGAAPYVAAKHGLGGLTKALALELAEHGICVNAVAPGEISTPMTGQEDVDPHTQARPMIPAGRPGDAREIASLVAWLCSEEAGYVTGSSYLADGGMMLMAAVANAEARPA